MDIISHALIGRVISTTVSRNSRKPKIAWFIFFSILADIPFIPYYLILGYENRRQFFIPLNSDWIGASISHPFLDLFLREIFHSFVFTFLVIFPLVWLFKLPKGVFLVYLIHLLIDIPTHSGEWAIKPFYPFSNYSINGFTDAWSWPIKYMITSWIIILMIIIFLEIFLKRKKLENKLV
jgi:membrane-bound metal-dependent hydrolase YbcI (DUF457 family)